MEVTSRTRIIVGLTFAAYSLITILLGIWSTRQARKTDTSGSGFGKNFYAGGGNMNWLLVGMMRRLAALPAEPSSPTQALPTAGGLCGVSVCSAPFS